MISSGSSSSSRLCLDCLDECCNQEEVEEIECEHQVAGGDSKADSNSKQSIQVPK